MGCDCGIGNAPDAITTPKNLLRQHSNDKTGGKHHLFSLLGVGTIAIKRTSRDCATRFSTSDCFLNQFPYVPEYPIRAVSNFFEIRRDIRS